jgi:hypothetical protein
MSNTNTGKYNLVIADIVIALVDTFAIRSGPERFCDVLDVGDTIYDGLNRPILVSTSDLVKIDFTLVRSDDSGIADCTYFSLRYTGIHELSDIRDTWSHHLRQSVSRTYGSAVMIRRTRRV